MIGFEQLIDAAQEHGDDEGAEVQIGDLEILFAVAFGLLTEDQQSRFFADPDISDLLEVLGMRGSTAMNDEDPRHCSSSWPRR